MGWIFGLLINCLLRKTDTDREEGGGKENDIEKSLLRGLEQHGRDVNWMGRGYKVDGGKYRFTVVELKEDSMKKM